MIRFDLRPWAVFLIIGSLEGCRVNPPLQPVDSIKERELAPEVVADARSLVEANNRFALDLYGRLRSPSGNLILSPYSISTAFAMVHAGAAGQTEREMLDVFHFPLPQERLHATFGALQRSLDRGAQLGGYELRVANRVWGQKAFGFRPTYLEVTRKHYGAEMQEADFQRDPESARGAINDWVEQQTNHKIRDLFPAGSINPDTRLALASAIYFKGLWFKQFDTQRTADAPFHLSSSQDTPVPMMRQEEKFRIAGSPEVQVLELPYRGGDLSMLILLPRRVDGLGELETGLSLQGVNELRAGLREEKILVMLPRFKFTSKFGLPEVLSGMGMASAFTPGAADFSGISGGRDLYLAAALHQAFVEVNEEGTEAAAATGIGVGVVSMPPSFIADHPFLFLIRDNVTGSILFLGRVVDPRA